MIVTQWSRAAARLESDNKAALDLSPVEPVRIVDDLDALPHFCKCSEEDGLPLGVFVFELRVEPVFPGTIAQRERVARNGFVQLVERPAERET